MLAKAIELEEEIESMFEMLLKQYRLNITVKQLVERVYFKRYATKPSVSSKLFLSPVPVSTSEIVGLSQLDLKRMAATILEADILLNRLVKSDALIAEVLKNLMRNGV